ncbi:MAG: biopolymer transporter ExbD [Pseudomonadota bacterium]
MRLEPEFRRKRLTLTPLIDVIFLLLLFFMLSSTFSRFGDVELVASGTGGLGQDLVTAFAQLSQNGVSLNGVPIEMSGLSERLLELSAKQQVNAVVLSVSDTASSQQLVDVLVAIRAIEGVAVQLVR